MVAWLRLRSVEGAAEAEEVNVCSISRDSKRQEFDADRIRRGFDYDVGALRIGRTWQT